MKIQLKDLQPNPFRDIDNYPINQEKVESLVNSIEQTGFWDNVLARPKPGHSELTATFTINSQAEYDKDVCEEIVVGPQVAEKDFDEGKHLFVVDKPTDSGGGAYYCRPIIELAYGHHRLIALEQLYAPDHEIDIPVKQLDDATMLRILAHENYDSWGATPKIIDETIRVARKFLKEHPECVKTKKPKSHSRAVSPGGDRIYRRSPEAFQISEFLGDNWGEKKVYYSLKRLGLIEEERLDKEAIERMPTDEAAQRFVSAVKSTGAKLLQQQIAAKRIVESGNYSDTGIERTLSDVIYETLPPEKRIKKSKEVEKTIDFDNYLKETIKIMRDLNLRLEVISNMLKNPDIITVSLTIKQLRNLASGILQNIKFILEE